MGCHGVCGSYCRAFLIIGIPVGFSSLIAFEFFALCFAELEELALMQVCRTGEDVHCVLHVSKQ